MDVTTGLQVTPAPNLELLDLDSRPTFVLDARFLHDNFEIGSLLVHANTALQARPSVLSALNAEVANSKDASPGRVCQLRPWLAHCQNLGSMGSLPVFRFCDMLWEFCSSSWEWLIISARSSKVVLWQPGPESIPAGRPMTGGVLHIASSTETTKNPSLELSTSSVTGARLPAGPDELVTDEGLLRRIKLIKHVAIVITRSSGRIMFANDHFYDLTGYPRQETDGLLWLQVFEEDEISWMEKLWIEQVDSTDVVTWEAKLNRKWKPPPEYAHVGENEPLWVSGSGQMIVEDGITVGSIGCFVDISSQKWLEAQQKILLERAIDRAELSEQVITKTLEAATNENRFQRLADGLAVGVYIAGPDAVINYANPSYWKILGIGSSDKTPKIWLEAMEEDQLAQAAIGFKLVYEQKVPVKGIEIRLKRRFNPSDDQQISVEVSSQLPHAWVLFQAYPELGNDGSVLQVVGCVTDISHQKWVEGFISQQKEDAIAARLEQERFMDMTSHEIRNPLAAVIHCADEIVETLASRGVSKTVLNNHDAEDILNAAGTILTCSRHARRIMDDVLTFSKMGARLLKIHPVPCQPVVLLKNALSIFQGDAIASEATLHFHVHDSLKQLGVDWVLLDQGRCLQIVANLVTNALKFVRNQPERTVDVTVAATLERASMTTKPGFNFLDTDKIRRISTDTDSCNGEDVYIHVVVDDTGCGIPASEQTKLFGRFFQASHKTHAQYGGSGLGLSISKELCELQAGQIGFASEAGKGSTFAFYVRTTRTTVPGSEAADSPPTLAASINPGRQKTSGLKRTSSGDISPKPSPKVPMSSHVLDVLLVEDNLTNQKVLQRQLQRHKHRVVVANNGLEALEVIKTTEYWRDCANLPQRLSLILLDVEMPIMDGISCIRRIRELEAEGAIVHHIPVVAVTANARQEQIDRALEAGMDDVLCKPFQYKELVQVMQRLT